MIIKNWAVKFAQFNNEFHFITGIVLFQSGVYTSAQINQHFCIETRGSLDVHQPIVAVLPSKLQGFGNPELHLFNVREFSRLNFDETFAVRDGVSWQIKMKCFGYYCANSYADWSCHS